MKRFLGSLTLVVIALAFLMPRAHAAHYMQICKAALALQWVASDAGLITSIYGCTVLDTHEKLEMFDADEMVDPHIAILVSDGRPSPQSFAQLVGGKVVMLKNLEHGGWVERTTLHFDAGEIALMKSANMPIPGGYLVAGMYEPNSGLWFVLAAALKASVGATTQKRSNPR